MFAFDAQQALGLIVAQTSQIEAQVYEIQYPDIQYPSLVPVDTSANPWAKSVTFFSTDKLGQADWFNHQAKDLPLADVERAKFEQPVELAAIRLCALCLLMLAAAGCASTPTAGAAADSACLVVAEPPVTPAWVESADQAWIDWLAPIVDYGQRHCGWR